MNLKSKTANTVILFLALTLLMSTKCKSDTKIDLKIPMENFETKSYEAIWKTVDSLEQKGLFASAVEVCKEIYKKASLENNTNQMVKALVTRLKFSSYIQEDELKIAIGELDSIAGISNYPMNAIIHSITAQTYWQYYQQNRWKIQQRTTIKDFKNTDIDTWSFDLFQMHSKKHYELSILEAEKLQNTPIDNYNTLILGDSTTRYLRPTLYDLLAHRAIDFFSNNEAQINQPVKTFEINTPDYFADNKSFVNIQIPLVDSASFSKSAIQLLQNVTKFHLEKNNVDALIDVTIKRLSFVKEISTSNDKDELYLKSLENLKLLHSSNPENSMIDFQLALYWQQKGMLYDAQKGVDNRWDVQKSKEICESAIQRFPESFGASKCRSLLAQLENKSFGVKIESFNLPNKNSKALLSYKNIKNIYFCIVNIPANEWRNVSSTIYSNKELFEKLAKESKLSRWSQVLNDEGDLQNHALEIMIPPLPFGHYLLLASTTENFTTDAEATAYAAFNATELGVQNRSGINGNQQFMVFDRESGTPLEGVNTKVNYFEYGYRNNDGEREKIISTESYFTDKNGIVAIPSNKSNRNYYVQFSRGKDSITLPNNYYGYDRTNQQTTETLTNFFLDRAIYRPGQIIYFKGIVVQQFGNNSTIKVGEKKTITLYDSNNQEISKQNFTTNEFGTFNGTFNIPINSLNGNMYLSCESGSAYFQVEEYKRPKFKASFDKVIGSYKLDDEITVSGMAETFAGTAVDGASIAFRIVRNTSYPCWKWWQPYPIYGAEKEIANGNIVTDATGKFEIKFNAIADKTVDKKTLPTFNYTIFADITDLNGETHSLQTLVSAGYKAFTLNTSIENQWDKNKTKTIAINALNSNSEKIIVSGVLEIYKLKEPKTIFRKRLWENPDQFIIEKKDYIANFPNDAFDKEDQFENWEKGNSIKSFDFNTAKTDSINVGEVKNWATGKYYMKGSAKDSKGNIVEMETYFTIFDDQSKLPSTQTIFEIQDLKTKGEPGEKAAFLLSTAEVKQKIFIEVEHENKIVAQYWLNLNNEQKLTEFPIEEKYRGNFTIHFSSVRHGRCFSETKTVEVPFSNKELDIKFSTFRNKLLPGQKEEWSITVKGKKGDAVAAEILASMYDASLDQFVAHDWYFNLYNANNVACNWQTTASFGFSISQLFSNYWNKNTVESHREYEYLNGFGFNTQYDSYSSRTRGNGMVMKSAMAKMESDGEVLSEAATVQTSSSMYTKEGKNDLANINSSKPNQNEPTSPIKARTDFNETAFFYPNLKTDANGNAIITFVAPEALTQWKFMALAHTKDLKVGKLMETAVTQKDLMVFPNAPRFLREKDQLILSTKIASLADKILNGSAKLELFDATNMKPIDALFKNLTAEKPFSTKAKQSTTVDWEIIVPENIQAVVYKITATADNFSDGEENTLPVLSNRMLITETMPLPVKGKSTKSFTLEKLKNSVSGGTLSNHQLTLEFTANPAWYAVQALPYMMENPYDCSEQIFSRFYANSLATNLINTKPIIKKVFDGWKLSSPGAFLSNLEKNQELKSTIITETPWLLDAKNESESKKRIALFFDLNKMTNELQLALQKLEENQYPNGSFPWFKGMYENRYITQYIVEGMGHLDHLKVKNIRADERVWNMVLKAIDYCDNQLVKDLKEIKKDSKNYKTENHLSVHHIQYLYARSFFKDVSLNIDAQEAVNYFTNQGTKYWLSQNLYMQAMLSIAINRSNNATAALDIIKSLKERAIVKEELGMYWKEFNAGYYWQEAPIEQQAMMIEAFDEVTKDAVAVNELKVWLLKQKQTQNWKTTKATAQACYALLLKGNDWLEEVANPNITIGDQKIVFSNGVDNKKEKHVQSEAGTGYFKTKWNANEIENNMANITIESKSESIAFGALYWQYFEQLDKITPATTPLKLVKKLYKEVITDAGLQLVMIENNTPLKPGDKIKVRIELIVDRNMEYIHLKDMRASGLEPITTISQTKYQNGVSYYETMKDASANFFFDYLPRGTYVFEYPLYVNVKGNFSNGITTAQCMYAPEFSAHSEGVRINIK
jgi:Bacterial Alpha-2-macroglobulin MG10 domain/Alpha-2-macroglobulin family/MG2 domain